MLSSSGNNKQSKDTYIKNLIDTNTNYRNNVINRTPANTAQYRYTNWTIPTTIKSNAPVNSLGMPSVPRFTPQGVREEIKNTRTLWTTYKQRILDAVQLKKIFVVYGHSPLIRQELLNRGWLEKLPSARFYKLQNLDDDTLMKYAKSGNEYEMVALSRLLRTYPAYFVWQDRTQTDQHINSLPYRNIIRRAPSMDFATKVGLLGCADQDKFYFKEGTMGMNIPRFYKLGGHNDDRDAFLNDFRITQCMALLTYTKDRINEPHKIYDMERGKLPTWILNFAVGHLKKFLGDMEHFHLDSYLRPDYSSLEWQQFCFLSNELIRNRGKFRGAFRDIIMLARTGEVYIKKIYERRPNMRYDGWRNLWILKPGFQCRGSGIIVRYLLDDILTFTTANANRRYIAQKYIERPLLIYNTKFDIRQYMLLTIGDKVIRIWLYKDCYLKFSGQEFNLDDLNESIHLTNNTVQRKYKNSRNRDSRLPLSNMWSLDQLRDYLKSMNVLDSTWETKVFAGFKRNLIAVVMASMEETYIQPNAFELYGCDFMLDEQFNPILIEINSAPDMSASTEVTARLCPQVLKDVIKVVVDLPKKPFASSGGFELVFEQNYKGYSADSRLSVSGHAMHIEPYKSYKTPQGKMSIHKKASLEKANKVEVAPSSTKGVVLNRPDAGPSKASIVKKKSVETSTAKPKKRVEGKKSTHSTSSKSRSTTTFK